jgi:hypothetical protein
MIDLLKQFFRYAFLGQPERIVEIYSQEIIDETETEQRITQVERYSSMKFLITAMNWVALIILAASSMAIIAFIFIYPDKPTPCIIENICATTLAWVLSALGAFWGTRQP